MPKDRIIWVDTFKFLGIYAIYIGHFGHAAGNAYDFVFRYHVALFFFAAGFFAGNYHRENIYRNIIKKIKAILIPYFIYSLIFILILSITESWNGEKLFNSLETAFTGIRNDHNVGSLWFLNCIFVTFVIDILVIKFVKNKWLVSLISFAALVYTQKFMGHNPRVEPSWFWNIDSALSFWFFMTAGRCLFTYLNSARAFDISDKFSYPLIAISSVIAALYFYEGPGWLLSTARRVINDKDKTAWFIFMLMYSTIGSLMLIIFNVYLAKLLSKFNIFNKLGASTLNLCGLENTIKLLLPQLLIIFGLDIVLKNPLSTYLYTFICLLFAYKTSTLLSKRIPFLPKS